LGSCTKCPVHLVGTGAQMAFSLPSKVKEWGDRSLYLHAAQILEVGYPHKWGDLK
jgi:hypothetical protein